MKKFARIFWKPVYFIFWCLFQLVKWTGILLWWLLVKIFLWPLRSPKDHKRNVGASEIASASSPAKELVFSEEIPCLEKEPPMEDLHALFPREERQGRPSVTKIGSILPREEDQNLRTFTILNNEGEIFRINTASHGAFYGPLWTRILSCYENRETLCARLTEPVYGKSGNQSGYRVKIGSIRAFMPNYHSLRFDLKEGINIRVSVVHIDPVSQRVIVSARVAYEILFAHHTNPQVGASCEALYWDYDDEKVYFLLPGRYVGWCFSQEASTKVAASMGTLVQCHIESLNPQAREAVIAFPALESEKMESVNIGITGA